MSPNHLYQYKLSMYRGENHSLVIKQKREICLLQTIQGEATIYLFNPKHEGDIKGMPLQSIKKWAIKTTLNPESSLYIPPEWYYFYETNQDVLLVTIQCDTVFTVVYNLLRK